MEQALNYYLQQSFFRNKERINNIMDLISFISMHLKSNALN